MPRPPAQAPRALPTLYENAHPIHDETLERALGEAVTQPELAPVVHALQAVTAEA